MSMQPYMRPMHLRPVRLFHRQNATSAAASDPENSDATPAVAVASSSMPPLVPRKDGSGCCDTVTRHTSGARDVAVFALATAINGNGGNASCNSVQDNLRKWQNFGMNTTRYAMSGVGGSASGTQLSASEAVCDEMAAAQRPVTIISSRKVNDSIVRHAQPSHSDHAAQAMNAATAQVVEPSASAASSASLQQVNPVDDLRHQLREVAHKVVNNTEAERCAQPRPQTVHFRGGFRGGRKESGRLTRQGRINGKAAALTTPQRSGRLKDTEKACDEDADLPLSHLNTPTKTSPGKPRRGRGKESSAADLQMITDDSVDAEKVQSDGLDIVCRSSIDEGGARRGSSRVKRPRKSAAAADKDESASAGRPSRGGAAAATATASPKRRKRSRKTAESEAGLTLRDLFGHDSGRSGEGAAATHTRSLFAFSPGLPGSHLVDGSSEAALSVPYEELHDTTSLFADLTRALNDPDRIQAPPLFVGFLLRPPYSHSNFSLSAVSGGKAHFVAGVDPRSAHRVVQSFALRWRDKAYVVKAMPLGFELLLRVLHELPGVELITFHAPALLLPLLGYLAEHNNCGSGGQAAASTLVTHCVSDVRVMGWMAHITESDGAEAAVADCAVLQRLCGSKCVATTTKTLTTSRSTRDLVGSTLQELVNQVYTLAPLYSVLYGQLGAKGLLQAFLRQEKRIALLLAIMKRDGFVVDLAEVAAFKANCTAHMNAIRDAACALVPELPDFNIQSHDHCRQAIYEVLQLGRFLMDDNGSTAASVAITKGGKLSTAEETLRLLAPKHPFPRLLLRYRKVAKIQQTYLEGMMSLAIPCSTNEEEGQTLTTAENASHDGTGVKETDLFSDSAAVQLGEALVDKTNTAAAACKDEQEETLSEMMQRHIRAGSSPRAMSLPTQGYARLHANFLQEGTDTGRLSCVEPNLQNIPRCALTFAVIPTATTATEADMNTAGGDEEVKEKTTKDVVQAGTCSIEQAEWVLDFRRCLVAPPGHCLLSVDYGQIELRVLAHLCEDPALVAAMTQATDIHRRIAEMVFKKASVTHEERNLSKRVVFGIIYGAGPRTLAAQMDLRVEDALHISSLLKAAFPRIAAYHQQVIDQSRQDGFVRTMSGRLRYLPDINSTVMVKRAYAERQAFNTVVQGSAADVMKMGMLAIEHDVLHGYGSAVQLLTQIHDEVILAVRKDVLREVVPKVMHAMTHAVSLLVPLRVTAKVGPSLAQLEEWSVDHDLGIKDVV